MYSTRPASSPLFLAELFEAILECLAQPSSMDPSLHEPGVQVLLPERIGRQTMAALARTCRAFSEPSLNHLWRKLSTLAPLFWCYAPRPGVLSTPGMYAPTQSDWEAIHRYSHRIRELEIQDDGSCLFLGCTIFESGLLPNLKVLKWKARSHMNTTGITYIQPLLVPGLVALDVGVTENDVALISFLKAFPSRCPTLRTLNLHIHGDGGEWIDTLSSALRTFKGLECLVLGASVNESALKQLLMSDLQELSLHLGEVSLPSSDIPFPNAKKLEFLLKNLRSVDELLRPGNQSFHQIKLHLRTAEPADNIRSLFSKLAAHQVKSPLRSLRLRGTLSSPYPKEFDVSVLSFGTLRPLGSLSSLQDLVIQLKNPISLCDKELAELARNWPLLQTIRLCHNFRFRAKCITFKGLLSLIALCPELHSIALTLDGREVPLKVAQELQCDRVTALHFPNSLFSNPVLVHKFLAKHFTTAAFSLPYIGAVGWPMGGPGGFESEILGQEEGDVSVSVYQYPL